MFLPPPPEKGIPKRYREWLSLLRDAILSAQPKSGNFVTVDEHIGQGTVVNVASARNHGLGQPPCGFNGFPPCGPGGTDVGACCHGPACSVVSHLSCVASGGTYLGRGTTCTEGACGASGMGACCTGGVCTVTTESGCTGGTWIAGADCSDPSICSGEPTGACCQTPLAMCTVTTLSGCTGIWNEGVPCSDVGSCESDFCGPGNIYCGNQCDDGSHVPHVNNPHCCGTGATFCGCCYDPTGGFYYTCCCHHNPPFGDVCDGYGG